MLKRNNKYIVKNIEQLVKGAKDTGANERQNLQSSVSYSNLIDSNLSHHASEITAG